MSIQVKVGSTVRYKGDDDDTKYKLHEIDEKSGLVLICKLGIDVNKPIIDGNVTIYQGYWCDPEDLEILEKE